MNRTEKPSLKTLSALKPRSPVSLSEESLVRVGPWSDRQSLPVVVHPVVDGLDLLAWAADHRSEIERLLLEHRALLLRGFRIGGAEAFHRFVEVIAAGKLLEYRDRSSPRHAVAGKIYTSTDYPADQRIFLHNEGTYWLSWPLKIAFFCETAPEVGGETPIADCRRIAARIPPSVRRLFEDRGVMYVRNFNDGLGLTWQTVFQTEDRAAVEEYCRDNDIAAEWKPGGRLRTRQVRQAVARHPKTGEDLWFNHGTFFHVTTLAPSVRAELLAEFAEDELPFNTYYGDGSPIEPEVLDTLRAAYEEETVRFPWQEKDILLLDNMTVAHGRAPYQGPRKVLVGMAEPHGPGQRT